MEIITNQLLKAWSKDKDLLNRQIKLGFESPKLKELDEKISIEAGENFGHLCANNVGFRRLWKDLALSEDRKILTHIALTHYYAKKALEMRKELEKQITECESFLKTDMCVRNLNLAIHTEQELSILKSAKITDHVKDIVSAFDLLIKRGKGKSSARQRYIEISEIMNHLGLESNGKPFLTLDEAKQIVEDKLAYDPNYNQTPEDLVSGRIKKILNR